MNHSTGAVHSDWFGESKETVVLLGFSNVVDFAKSEGFRTAVVASSFSLEDVFRVDHPIQHDPEDETAVRKSLLDLSGPHKVRGISAFDDISVLIAAKAGEWLQLEHAPAVNAVHNCIRKDEMRRILASEPTLALPYRVVEHEDDVSDALDEIGLPAVIKPVDSSNSRHVEFCPDKAAARTGARAILDWAKKNGKTERVLIEPYVEGPEFSVESFTQNGETTVMAVCEKIVGPLPYFVEIGHYCPTRQSRDVEQSLIETARSAIAALGIDNLVTHTELRLTPQGNKIIEINPRPAGGMLQEFIRTITGYDLHEAAVQLALGRRPVARPARASHGYYHCLTTNAEGVVSYDTRYLRDPLANGLYPVVELMVLAQEQVYPVNHQDGKILGRVLVYGSGFDVLHEEIRKILGELQFRITPNGRSQGIRPPTADDPRPTGIDATSVAPDWIPGYGWIWLPQAGPRAAATPRIPTVQRAQPLPESAERVTTAQLNEPKSGRPRGAEVSITDLRLETTTARPAPGGSSIPMHADNSDGSGQKGFCCASSPDDGGPTKKAEEPIRTGSGAWDKGCC